MKKYGSPHFSTLRGKHDVTFGVWCEVVASGALRVGDVVAVTG